MGKRYVPSFKGPDKYRDFKKFVKKHPEMSVTQLAGAYHVSPTTVYKWRGQLKKEEEARHGRLDSSEVL